MHMENVLSLLLDGNSVLSVTHIPHLAMHLFCSGVFAERCHKCG